MSCQLILNWKSFVALGFVLVGGIFAAKMTPEQAKEVSIHAIDTYKEVNSVNRID